MRALSPSSIRPPLANYSHGIAVPAGHRLVFVAGQLGIAPDDRIPEDSEAQADQQNAENQPPDDPPAGLRNQS